MSGITPLTAVFRKELTDALRDRRSLISAFAFAFFGPLFLAMVLGSLARSQEIDGPLEVPVLGADEAPGLISHLERQGATIVDAPEDPEVAIRDGSVDFVVIVPDGYGEAWNSLRPAPIQVLYDSSRSSGASRRQQVEGWLQGWGSETAQLRLLARGVDPSITRPLEVQRQDFASTMALAAKILGSLPVFFLLATFVCAMNVAIDTTAGERERGSLESLLAHAAPNSQLAAGKWLAAVVLNLLGLVAMLGVSILALRPERFEGLGVTVQFGRAEALSVFWVLVPLVLMAPALQMVMAIFAKSFKEAQTYLSLMIFVPMIPGFLLMTETLEVVPWMHGVPVLAQQIQILDLLKAQPATLAQLALGALATGLATFALVALIGRLLGRERIVLAR